MLLAIICVRDTTTMRHRCELVLTHSTGGSGCHVVAVCHFKIFCSFQNPDSSRFVPYQTVSLGKKITLKNMLTVKASSSLLVCGA